MARMPVGLRPYQSPLVPPPSPPPVHYGTSSYMSHRSPYDPFHLQSRYEKHAAGYEKHAAGYEKHAAGYDKYPAVYDKYDKYPAVHDKYDKYPDVYDKYDKYPDVYDKYPAVYDKYPAVYDKYPSAYDKYPAVYEKHPTGYEKYLALYEKYPAGYEDYPAGYDKHPVGYEKHPAGRGRGRRMGMPMGKEASDLLQGGLKGPWQKTEKKDKESLAKLEPDKQTGTNQSNGVLQITAEQNKANSGTSSAETVVQKEKLPKELVKKFQPLKCDLCVVKMNSPVQAKMHYDGKQHLKKVRMFMVNWAKEKGQPVPKQTVKKKEEPPAKKYVDPEELYCKCCDLSFTSALHAQQHYMGRNHRRVRGGLTPLRTGYYNKCTGKWQRLPPEEDLRNVKPLITGNFQKQKKPEVTTDISEGEPVVKKGRFFCDLCNVGATSQEQLDMHYNGAKHKKAMKSSSTKQAVLAPVDSILASVIKPEDGLNNIKKLKLRDYSIFRTPSGRYYCAPCNITLNSESQFSQHSESKKHKVKVVAAKTGTK